jgi:hypothetical protein
MSDARIQTGSIEPIEAWIAGDTGAPLTGLTDCYVRLRRLSDGRYLDWSDMTFKASGWVVLSKILTELDATRAPGMYSVVGGLDTGAVTNHVNNDTYTVYPLQDPGNTAVLPAPGEILVGRWLDDIDATMSTLALESTVGALNNLSSADVQTAMTTQGYTTARAPKLDYLDASIAGLPTVATIWGRLVETGYTAEEILRVAAAVLAGKVSGTVTNAPVFRAINDSKVRLSATTNDTGDRLTVTIDKT